VNLLKSFVHYVPQRIGFVPTVWEYIKRYLTTNRVGKAVVGKLFLKDLDKGCSQAMFLRVVSIYWEHRYADVYLVMDLERSALLDTNVYDQRTLQVTIEHCKCTLRCDQ
jgi:hypothetical protein